MIGEVLALLSAAASGISVVLVRKYSAGASVFNMSLVITAIGMMVLWPLAFMEAGFNMLTVASFALFAVSGLFSPGLVRLFYYKGLKTLGASANSAIFSVYPFYSSVLAVVLLGELVTAWNVFGIVAIVAGVILIERFTYGSGEAGRVGHKSLIIPILGGVMLGGATIFRKMALDASNVPILGVAIAYVFSLLPYILLLGTSASTRKNLTLKKNVRWFWMAGVGQAISWLLAFSALSFGTVSLTTPLLAVEPLFVVAFGYLYLREVEHVSAKLVASIAVTVLGVALVTI
jgi:drug/metabolite transporter (DMT)-like permease